MPQTVIAPFAKVSDVDVIMKIEKPEPLIGLGNLVILTTEKPTASAATGGSAAAGSGSQSSTPAAKSGTGDTFPHNATLATGLLMSKTDTVSGANYSEYADLDAIALDYPESTDIYRKAAAYFVQSNPSDRIAVLSIADKTKMKDSLKAFWFNNWTFAVVSDELEPSATGDDDALNISNIFEANKDHFLFLQGDFINNPDEVKNLEGQDFTVLISHDPAEAMDAALIGNTASLPVGSVTWKFRNLTDITPEYVTTGELEGLNTLHAIAYIVVNGRGETSEGFTASGEYIDNEHGDIWIKSNIQGKLEYTLQTNDKIPYEASGINLLASQVTGVLEQAWEQGIILTNDQTKKGDYTVTATPRSAQPAGDISKRHYGGLSFTYHRSGAIHTVTVNGTVQSDTITA